MTETGRLPSSVTQELAQHGLFDIKPVTPVLDETSDARLMQGFLQGVRATGIEASGKLAPYATIIETPEWVVDVVDQRSLIVRIIVTSYRNIESELKENPEDLAAVKRAMASPNFVSDARFSSIRAYLKYNHRIDSTGSPVDACIQEYVDRKAGKNFP